jgi:probable HAF family extracellular repeat protein
MRHMSYAFMIVALAGCGSESELTQPPATATRQAGKPAAKLAVEYEIVKLPSLGGTQSRGMAINDGGVVAGWSNRSDGNRHAALWRNTTTVTDLLTLGGPMSTVPWPGQNDAGVIVGISHTGIVDPLDEDWACEFAGFLPATTNLICRGFVYENGAMRELPPLGGNHSFAAGVNNVGDVVGWAETAVHDPTCDPTTSQVLQFRAVLWDPKSGTSSRIKARQLRPYPGDSTSAATAINDAGVAVGISGACDQAVGRFSALRAVRWDKNGKVDTIPTLGGVTWHTPMDINEHGDIVGFSNPPGEVPLGNFIPHAFLWISGADTAVDLSTLPGDVVSEAFAINSHGQVVGISFGGAAGPRAFIYQNGILTNLNDLVAIGNDVLMSAQDINDDGVITGRVLDPVTGEIFAFVATPIAQSASAASTAP